MNDRIATGRRITQAENIPPREGRPVTVGDVEIAIFNLDGPLPDHREQVPAQGRPACATASSPAPPWFARCTGGASIWRPAWPVRASEPACVAMFPTRVEDGIIFVDLGGARKSQEEAAA